MAMISGPIGVFDSGYGGLTILSQIRKQMPEYDFLYLGDNARTPYGTRSFEVVYEFTSQAVRKLFDMGCPIVILACNTASAKALRTIQQIDLPKIDPSRRVLGIIRPTVEYLDEITETRHVGILATSGTIKSQSYPLEIKKLFPDITVSCEACPIWVPLVENGEAHSEGADYFIRRHIDNLMAKDDRIDTIILGCTHYPILYNKICKYTPEHIKVIKQGEYVGRSLVSYMRRHPEMDSLCTRQGTCQFLTTESGDIFKDYASIFFNEDIYVRSIALK